MINLVAPVEKQEEEETRSFRNDGGHRNRCHDMGEGRASGLVLKTAPVKFFFLRLRKRKKGKGGK